MGNLKIIIGDIVSDELLRTHDLIVNPTNPRMVCGGGVSGAIFHKAGVDALEEYTAKTYGIDYSNYDNLMKVGEIRITPGFNGGIDIMFAQGPRAYEYDSETALKLLLETYKNIVEAAYEKGYKNILCPSFGTGSYGFEHENTAKHVMRTLKESLKGRDINFSLVIYDEKDAKYYE